MLAALPLARLLFLVTAHRGLQLLVSARAVNHRREAQSILFPDRRGTFRKLDRWGKLSRWKQARKSHRGLNAQQVHAPLTPSITTVLHKRPSSNQTAGMRRSQHLELPLTGSDS